MTVVNLRNQEEEEVVVDTASSPEIPESGVVNPRNHGYDNTPTKTVILNGEEIEVTQIDADTYRLPEGMKIQGSNLIRASQINTAETPKLFLNEEGNFYFDPLDTTYANIEQDQINRFAEEGGYDTITTTGKTGKFGRPLYETTNEHGRVLEEELIEQDIVKPGSWTDNEVTLNRSMNQFKNMLNGYSNAMTPGATASAVTNYALANTPYDFYGSFGEISGGWNAPVDPVKQSQGFFDETTDSLYLGMVRLEHSAAAFTEWFSDVLGADEFGEDWVESTERKIARIDNTNINDIWDFHGNKFAKDADVGSFLQFFSNTMVEFAPQLAVLYGAGKTGAMVGGAIGGPPGALIGAGIATTAAAFMMAVGEFYTSMPDDEKDPLVAAGWALPIALVDKLGLSKAALAGKNVLTKAGKEEVISKMVAKGMTREAAEKKLKKSIFEVFEEASVEMSEAATAQLIAKKGFKDFAFHTAGAMGKEGLTEGIQEAIQYYGLTHSTSIAFNYEELLEASITGAVIGGIAATPFGVGQALGERSQIDQIFFEHGHESGKRSEESLIEEALLVGEGENKTKQSKSEMSTDVKTNVNPPNITGNLNENYNKSDKRTFGKDTVSILRSPKKALRNWKMNIVWDYLFRGDGKVNINVAKIASLIDAIRVNSGLSAPKQTKVNFNKVHMNLRGEAELFTQAGVKTNEEWLALKSKYDNDPNSLTEDQRQAIEGSIEDGKAAGKALADLAEANNVDLGLTRKQLEDGWLNTVGYFNPQSIDENWIATVADTVIPGVKGRRGAKVKWGRERAEKLAEDIKYNRNQPEVLEALVELGLLNHPALAKYKSVTGYQAQTKLIQQFARKIAHESLFGKNNEVVNRLLHQALQDKELTEQQFREMSAQLDDFFKALDNQYGNIESDLWRGVQDNLLFASQMMYMDTNFFANMAELAYGMLRLDYSQYHKFFGKAAREFALNIRDDLSRAGAKLSRDPRKKAKGAERYRDEGKYLTDISDQELLALEGNNTMSEWRQKMSSILFKLNLVSAQTNAIRAAVGAFGWNEIIKLVDSIDAARKRGYHTDESRWAWDRLSHYGVKQEDMLRAVDFFTDISEESMGNMDQDHPMYQMLAQNYEIAVIHFVDEFSARPEVGSGWKLSEDKRFGFFTQFKRFISHFTANQIPQLWNMYIRRGPPKTSYQAFVVIMTSFLLAGVAQYLKDLLKYEEEAPYLDEIDEDWWNNRVARAIKYTGWVGTPEMAIDAIMNYNRQSWKQPHERIMDTVLGQAPALNTLWDMAGYIGDIEDPKNQERLVGKLPFVGDPKRSREYIQSVLFGNGEK